LCRLCRCAWCVRARFPAARMLSLGALGVMGANKHVFGSASLLAAVLFAGGPASAMEQAKAPAPPSSSTFSMPSFFDGNRLPDLKDAWRGGAAAPASAPGETPAAPSPPNDDAALAAAKAAMVRAEEAGREAAAVREKAEELSSRFGAESAPAANDGGPTAGSDTSTGSIEPARTELPPPSALGVPPPADQPETIGSVADPNFREIAPSEAAPSTVAVPELPAKKQAALTREQDASAKAKAPVTAASPSSPKTAVGEGASSGSRTAPGSSSKADIMPANMGAFGWNSQPE